MELTKKYLEQLIADRIEESGVLEYKSAGSLGRSNAAKTEITKDISAFANAGGGTLIYGIAEYREGAMKHFPERYDPVNQQEFSREWLDQIAGQIQPRIDALEIVPIHVGPAVSDYCYALVIPQGNTAHQALDQKYYKRRNFESSPMQDHEIRDVMNRRRDPQLQVKIQLGLASDDHWYLNVSAKNVSLVIARHLQVIVELPPVLNRRVLVGPPGQAVIRDDRVLCFRITLRNKIDQPLFARDTKAWAVKLEQSAVRALPPDLANNPVLRKIHYRAFADQMPMIEAELDPTEVVVEVPTEPGSLSIDVLTNQATVVISRE
jgi:hypothetical protein